jgi:dihydroorotate dehydrogenase (NAD+) catalytic subunit
MKAKRRVVTSGRPGGAKRTPTVRRITSAIVPAPTIRPPARPPAPGPAAAYQELTGPDVDLTVDLGRGLVLANPIILAAGVAGYGAETAADAQLDRLGAICTRGTTLRSRTGNPPPRMARVPAGLINAVGLHDPGIETVIERYAPIWVGWSVPVIINLAASSVGDFVDLARRLEGVSGVAGIELDLSCPDQASGRLAFAADARAAAEVTAAVRRATELPLLAKLSPNVTDVRPIARAVADAGADAISAVNTVSGLVLAATRDRPLLGSVYGGLSGPAIRPIALRIVYETAQVVRIPVVGMGGVSSLADVLDFLAVGASAVAVGTAALADAAIPVRLLDDLAAECRRRGLDSHRPLVGTALPSRPGPPSSRGAEYRL